MAQTKDKEQYGREFAPECEFEVYELNDNIGWGASVAIGDCYYETDPCKDKQDAIAEQRGCLLAIKEQIENYLATLHRTPADIEAAMQEVEAKSEAYTNAHRGERDDDVLSQMRGDPVSEDLEKEGKEWLRPQLDKSYANYGEAKMMDLTHFDGYAMLEAIEFGANWKEQQLMKNVVLETEVLRDSDGDGVDTPYESWLTLANMEIPELPESLGLKEGDKVKILIVKSK